MTTRGIDVVEARELLALEGPLLYELLARAGRVRHELRGDVVHNCAIVSAKSGHCSQDCAFCAQSSRSKADIERYTLLPADEIVARAREAAEQGAERVGIVTSGRALSKDRELPVIREAIEKMSTSFEASPCASLGLLDAEALEELSKAGLSRYHHNLECSESFFPKVCSTRQWTDSIDTVEAAKKQSLLTCCGGIFGLGEEPRQRVELLESIRQLEVDAVPLNFLNPIAGTPLEDARGLKPLDCLKVIAVARLMMPEREIKVCGGREHALRDLQSWMLLAGADGLMVGGYLTTSGRSVADDLAMIRDVGLVPASPTP